MLAWLGGEKEEANEKPSANLEYEQEKHELHGPTGGKQNADVTIENRDPQRRSFSSALKPFPLNKENVEQLPGDRQGLVELFDNSSTSSPASSPASSPTCSCQTSGMALLKSPPSMMTASPPYLVQDIDKQETAPASNAPELWFPTEILVEELGDASQFPPG